MKDELTNALTPKQANQLISHALTPYQAIAVLNTLEEYKRYQVLDKYSIHDRYGNFSFDTRNFIQNTAFAMHFMNEVYKHMKEGGMIDEEEET